MVFERQRLLLTLLKGIGGPVAPKDFQKLLFLYTRECEGIPSFEFVPYRFGCFSFTSYADKRRLVDQGFLADNEQQWKLTASGRQLVRDRPIAPLSVSKFCRRYTDLRGNALIAEVYRRYPYYAIRSEIIEKVLPDEDSRQRIAKARPPHLDPGLLTIGYEGKCLEEYLNLLIQAGVTILCDVRRNPLSRKYGFSKGTLSKACDGVGIRYEHVPELGIASDQRRNLKTQNDYDVLFTMYVRTTLPHQQISLSRIRQWVADDRHRVALTCFEQLPTQCHRHCVAEALEHNESHGLTVTHL